MPGKQVNTVERTQIVQAIAMGMSCSEVAKRLGINKSTVSRIFSRWRLSSSIERKPGSGRKRKTTDRDDRQIMVYAKRTRFVSSSELLEALKLPKVSEDTIRRRIKQSGEFNSYLAVKKPLISKKNKSQRIKWCKEHKDWTVDQWRQVIWTDESPFVLRAQFRRKVWRMRSERYSPQCIQATMKHDKKIMVWGCFAAHGVGDLHRINGIMDQQIYRQILIHHLVPSAVRLFPDGNYIFQQDNDPKHTARSVKAYIANKPIPTMWWPAQSPDLNPIENLWSILDRRLKNRKCNSEAELFQVLQDGWKDLPVSLLDNLATSMPRRIAAVLAAKGMPTKY